MLHAEIEFPDEIANQVQAAVKKFGGSFEKFIQQAVVHELQRQQSDDLQSFFSNLQPLESFADINAEAYVDNIRSNSRIINE